MAFRRVFIDANGNMLKVLAGATPLLASRWEAAEPARIEATAAAEIRLVGGICKCE